MPHTPAELAIFCKKKGFIYPSSEIYGGVAGLYDYGHLGTRLKKNFENLWRSYFLSLSDNYHEIETACIMPEKVFEASGHLKNFIDPVVNCSKCEFHERADHFIERAIKRKVEGSSPEELSAYIHNNKLACPQCKAALKPVTVINMMFPVQMGVLHSQQSAQRAFLRPETAQSPYVNFKLQHELLRKKMPLGLALVGRAYRNEISPRNLTLRMREFSQAELQLFFNPAMMEKGYRYKEFELVKDYTLRMLLANERAAGKCTEKTVQELTGILPQFYIYHLVRIQQFYLEELGIPKEKFRFYQLNEQEKAFYNKYHFDIEIELAEHGFTEVGGLHYRTDHDLQGHQKVSGGSMEIFDEASGKRFIPHVLELSFGVDRNVYALLDLNYEDNKERGNIILHLPARLTPYFCAVFPLVKNRPEVLAKAEQVYEMVKKHYSCFYDESASVGRRYARADEMGVRYCITIDFETVEGPALRDTVTIRNREDTKQERVKIAGLISRLGELYSYSKSR